MLDYEITARDTAELLRAAREGDRSDFLLLDVREHVEYQTARVEGSLLIPMREIPSRVHELDPDSHIVTMCHAGVRSMNVALWLRDQGFERVQSMRGGIDAWSCTVDPDVPRY
jgi:rhodanese-related sulfurtransferase